MMLRILFWVEMAFAFLISSTTLQYSAPPATDELELIRAYTRQIEFNYINWTIDAVLVKLQSGSINLPYSLDRVTRKQVILEYLKITQLLLVKENQLEQIFADPDLRNNDSASSALRTELDAIRSRQSELAPLAEAVIQDQVSEVLSELNLAGLGQPIPGVLYHSSPLPHALIVSRRERIEQLANISLEIDFSLEDMIALEGNITQGLDVSSLVVPIGGIGVYPTMVMRTTDLRWLLETVAHEWTHNYLTLRPLGILYDATPELRTMNETTSSIAGSEISDAVIQRFYPEQVVSITNPVSISVPVARFVPAAISRTTFDFNSEMHKTRIRADLLLAKGLIEEAESYMESRRLIFLQNGYLIRKLNQAYFSFYGAYADVPGGAAGEDPVGPAVRELRARSHSLAEFINKISWMTSFAELQDEVN